MQVYFLFEIYNPPPSDFMPWDVGLMITDDLMHPYRAERAFGLSVCYSGFGVESPTPFQPDLCC